MLDSHRVYINMGKLNQEQIDILQTWYSLESDNLHIILQSIGKLSFICHLDENYHMKKSEAETLLTLSDLIVALIKAEDKSA